MKNKIAKHAPGPWRIEDAELSAAENARLIAAAPELLKAIRKLIKAGAPLESVGPESKRAPEMRAWVDAVFAAGAAIAKAEGKAAER